jgi:hypothetical protein
MIYLKPIIVISTKNIYIYIYIIIIIIIIIIQNWGGKDAVDSLRMTS